MTEREKAFRMHGASEPCAGGHVQNAKSIETD